MKERLVSIAAHEQCSLEDGQIDEILALAHGDMRRAVTTLQSAHALSAAGPLEHDTLAELAGIPPPTVMDNLWKSMGSFANMQSAVEHVCAEGFSASAMLTAISKKVVDDPILNDLCKAKLSIRIAEAEKNLVDGADEYLQLMTVCSLALTSFQNSQTSNP